MKIKNMIKAIIILLSLLNLINSQIIDIDYQPATEAFVNAKAIMGKYEGFKEKISKNITIEYGKCIEQIKSNKCNNIDQWQSVIEELKLQIQNSKEIELPFLQYRKNQKVERLKELINLGETQNQQFNAMQGKLLEYQGFLKDNTQFIQSMYKLPEQNGEDFQSFIQQIDVTHELNANSTNFLTKFFLVPDIGEQEVKSSRQKYDIGDISIQAQAARNVMDSSMNHIGQTLQTILQAQNITDNDQLLEKQQLKESIESLRALIANEQWAQAESQTKINELEGKIAACSGMPTSIQKDCEPLILKQKKKNAQIEIMKERTMGLFRDLKKLMEDNEPESDMQAHADSLKAQQQADFNRVVEESYLNEEKPAAKSQKAPEELKPIHHMKEQVLEEGIVKDN